MAFNSQDSRQPRANGWHTVDGGHPAAAWRDKACPPLRPQVTTRAGVARLAAFIAQTAGNHRLSPPALRSMRGHWLASLRTHVLLVRLLRSDACCPATGPLPALLPPLCRARPPAPQVAAERGGAAAAQPCRSPAAWPTHGGSSAHLRQPQWRPWHRPSTSSSPATATAAASTTASGTSGTACADACCRLSPLTQLQAPVPRTPAPSRRRRARYRCACRFRCANTSFFTHVLSHGM